LRGSSFRKRSNETVEDCDAAWACIDVDGYELENEDDPTTEAGRLEIVKSLISKLPRAFHTADFIYKWSSSAFLPIIDKTSSGDQVASIHLFFWLSRGLKTLELGAWLSGSIADPQLFKPAQLITVARPHFEELRDGVRFKMNDPLRDRIGLVKRQGSVDVPSLHIARLMANSSANQSQSKRHTKPYRELMMSSSDHNTKRGEAALSAAHQEVSSAQSDRRAILMNRARWLGRFVGAGYVSVSDAETTLMRAARDNGWINEKGRSGEREARDLIQWAIKTGSTLPLDDQPSYHPTFSPSPHRNSKRPKRAQSQEHQERVELPFVTNSGELIRSDICEALRGDHLTVLAIPAGAGKSHQAIEALVDEVSQDDEALRILLCRTRESVADVERSAREYALRKGLEPPITRLTSALEHCHYYDQADDEGRRNIERKYTSGGRTALCGREGYDRCERADDCLGSQAQSISSGLYIATHARGEYLGVDLPPNTVTIIDELPAPVKTETVDLSELETLLWTPNDEKSRALHEEGSAKYKPSKVNLWRYDHEDLGRLVESLLFILKQLSREVSKDKETMYAKTLPRDQLLKVLAPCLPELKALGERLIQGDPSLKAPPLQSAEKTRAQCEERDAPSQVAYELLCSLARYIARGQEPETISLSYQKSRVWFEHHLTYKLHPSVKVALDATAHECAPLWQQLAEQAQIKIEIKSRALQAPRPEAHFIQAKTMRSGELYKRTKSGEIRWDPRTVGALTNIAGEIEELLRDVPDHASIGLGSHKALADLFRKIISGEELSNEIEIEISKSPIVQVLSRFKEVVIGHTGAQDTGSNIFAHVDAFILLGTPKLNRGAVINQYRALGLSESEASYAYGGLTAAKTIQWLARARHVRPNQRERVKLVYIGDFLPEESIALPSVSWHVRQIKIGASNFENTELIIKILSWLERGEEVTHKRISTTFGVTLKRAKGLLARIAANQLLYQYRRSRGKDGGRAELVYSYHSPQGVDFVIHSRSLIYDESLMPNLPLSDNKDDEGREGVCDSPLRAHLLKAFARDIRRAPKREDFNIDDFISGFHDHLKSSHPDVIPISPPPLIETHQSFSLEVNV
jgi:hypothetical protein